MAIVEVDPFVLPMPPAAHAFANASTTGAGHRYANTFTAPRTGNIDRVAVRVGTAATPTNTDLRVESHAAGVQTPSGALVNAGAQATILAAAIVANAWVEAILGTAAAVVRGQPISVVLAPTGVPNIGWSRMSVAGLNIASAYTALFNGVSWTTSGASPICAVRYADTGLWTPVLGMWPLAGAGTTNLQSTTTPDEVGNLFSLPWGARVRGLIVDTSQAANATVMRPHLYDPGGADLLAAQDHDFGQISSGGLVYVPLTNPVDIAGAAVHRVTIEARTAGLNRGVRWIEVASAAFRDALNQGSSIDAALFTATERTNAGAWTDTPLRRWGVSPVIGGIEIPAGGSTSLRRLVLDDLSTVPI